MIKNKNQLKAVPQSMQIQLARLFGSNSREAKASSRTPAEWRRTLKQVLNEVFQYLEQNIDTDELHYIMLLSGFAAAHESLKCDDFWPGYAEGITRIAMVLMGDYPDHRKRKAGRKTFEHYQLNRYRTGHWTQTPNQRLYTLLAVGTVETPKLSKNPREAFSEFQRQYGSQPSYKKFMDWYRKTFPADYATVFR
jgi:hypothetical protein